MVRGSYNVRYLLFVFLSHFTKAAFVAFIELLRIVRFLFLFIVFTPYASMDHPSHITPPPPSPHPHIHTIYVYLLVYVIICFFLAFDIAILRCG